MPNRILKESICTSEDINNLSWLEEVFWYRLLVTVDDFGRMDARPAILKGKMFPLKDGITTKNIQEVLSTLASVGLIEIYEVDARPFLSVVKWDCHQQKRAKNSKYPSPAEADEKNIKNVASEIAGASICNQMISYVPEKRETRNEKRECEKTRNDNSVGGVFAVAEKCFTRPLTPMEFEYIAADFDVFGEKWMCEAFEIASKNGKNNYSYVLGILQNWKRNGYKAEKKPAKQQKPAFTAEGTNYDAILNKGVR